MTMVDWDERQRVLFADKLFDVANVAAGAMVFGQFLGQRPFSWVVALGGLALGCLIVVCSMAMAGRRQR